MKGVFTEYLPMSEEKAHRVLLDGKKECLWLQWMGEKNFKPVWWKKRVDTPKKDCLEFLIPAEFME